jgi:hypothetical protein
MVELTQARRTPERDRAEYVRRMAANVTILEGALVMLNAAGDATKGAAATGQIADGIALETKTNGAVAGATTVRVQPGTFRFANSAAADEVTRAAIGDDVFIVDDQTVAATNGGGTRSVAGRCVDVDAAGVWVVVGIR